MPRPITSKLIIKILRENGFSYVSQKGSHAKFRKIGTSTKTVIVKMSKKDIPHGTFQSILLQSGLVEKDFREKQKKPSANCGL